MRLGRHQKDRGPDLEVGHGVDRPHAEEEAVLGRVVPQQIRSVAAVVHQQRLCNMPADQPVVPAASKAGEKRKKEKKANKGKRCKVKKSRRGGRRGER